MPRIGRHYWLIAVLTVGATMARAQDDPAPPRKAPVGKKAVDPLPPDDLLIPPTPKKKTAPVGKKSIPNTIEFPGVALPDDPSGLKSNARQAPSTISIPPPNSPRPTNAAAPPTTVPLPMRAETNVGLDDAGISLSPPVVGQSKPRTKAPVETSSPKVEERSIPAPVAANSIQGPVAQSLPAELRRERGKTIEVVKTEPAANAAVVQTSALRPAPRAEELYEVVAPKLPTYDVIRPASAPAGDSIATVYETPGELLAGGKSNGDVVQVGATFAEGTNATIESYPVKIWKIDGWETYRELARMEYRDEGLAALLAKYNRNGFRATDPLPAGQKVRLPPKWVMERIGSTVARRPAPIRTDFKAPPATSVQAQPAGSGMVASSGDRKQGGLVRNSASPLPTERAAVPVDEGPVFEVKEPGMTLYKVSKRVLNDGAKWRAIYDLNRDRISSSDAELKVGTRLRLPQQAGMMR